MCDVLVATGEMFHDAIDLDLPGYPPFEFKRSYSTTSTEQGPMGWGWRHNWQVSLKFEDNGFRIYDGLDGEKMHLASDCDGKKGPKVQVDKDRQLAEFTYPDGRCLIFKRDANTAKDWLLHQRIDPHGNWAKSAYWDGRLVAILDSEKREIAFEYQLGQLAAVGVRHRGIDQRVCYRHDRQGRLIQVISPLGFSQQFDYEENLIVRYINETGLARYFCYDDRRRCVLNWYEADLKVRRLELSPDGRAALLHDSYGYRELYRLNDKGQPEKMIDPLGRQTEWVYTDDGGLLCKILPDGVPLATSTWDPKARVRRTTDLRGVQTVYHFDGTNNVVAIENAAGHSIRFKRDGRGDTVAILGPEGAHWRFEYDDRGSLSKVIDPKGDEIDRSESSGEVLLRDSHGVIGVYTFDALGNLLTDTDALDRITVYEYAGQDRPICMTLPDGRQIRWQYDPRGRITAVTDALGRTTRFAYSGFGTVIATTYPDGRTTRAILDKEGNITQIVNGKGEVTHLEYDEAFRQKQITFFDGRTDVYEFDSRNRVVALIDGRGQRTEFDYDGATNLVRIELADGTIQSNTYDDLERLIVMATEPPLGSDAAPKESRFTYNANNIITSEAHDGYEVQYEHDICGNLIAARNSLGREIRYQIGSRRRVERVEDGPRSYEFEYSAMGELTTIRLPNGMTQQFQFDICSRLIRREVLSPRGSLLAWRNFAYDAADQLISMEDWRLGEFLYQYDQGGRLISVTRPNAQVLEQYSYDLEGNLLTSPDFTNYQIDPGNRLRASDSVNYTYDGAGCLVAMDDGKIHWEMSYGHFNQLTRLIRDGALVAIYDYDLLGRRTRKILPDEEVKFYYHVNRLRTIDSSKYGRWNVLYAPGTLVPISQAQEDRCYYYSFDQIGTPTELWDENGNLVATLSSRSFGSGRTIDQVGRDVIPTPFHFIGQYVDAESGLHYNRFRYYSPGTARFLTHDPIGLAVGLNLYMYPTNPMNWVDPLGLNPLMLNCGLADGTAWDECQQWAAQQKLNAINKASKNRRRKTCTTCRENKQKQYFEETCGGNPAAGNHVDHVLELQLGGADYCCSNLLAIPGTVNMSFGSQIKNLIEGLDDNAIVPQFEFNPPGCDQAKHCKNKAQAVQRGTKSDGKDCSKEPPLDC